MTFEANLGQAATTAAFVGHGPGYAIHFNQDGISLIRGQDTVRMDLRGANPAHVTGLQLQEGRANYLIGSPDQWITEVPLYTKIQYREIYPGIDLTFYSNGGELEYDFILAPGASASAIRLAFQGIDDMRLDGGELVLKAGWGELRHRRPRIYQMRKGRQSEVAGKFVIRGAREAGFETESYDTGNGLIIDPVMAYGTYIGGAGADSAWAVSVDSAGAAYVVGETWPVNFPKTFTISNSGGNGDAFIVKLNSTGTAVLYATYFGGSARDSARGVAVDSSGSAYVTGFTNSLDFPSTSGAYRSPSLGQTDAFAIKINASGTGLVYSALIGGAGSDFATGIAIDSSGNAYIAGYTSSVAFPVTSGGFQKVFGGGLQDGFVAKLNASGSGLVYCTYLGGAGNDVANGLAVDAAGQAYVVGYTDSSNFPTRGALYANALGQGDAFVAKLSPAGDGLTFSTYLGGSLVDIATAVALDSSANVYVTGTTMSANFPATGGAFQTLNQGSYDAFVTKMDSQGARILYSTYVGGEGSEQSSSIGVDANGAAYIGGFTYSYHFPLQSPLISATHGGQEAFVAAVNPTGSSLLWSTYLGGAADDQATGIAVEPQGDVYVAGFTYSSDFPVTRGAYRTTYAGGDGFLIRLTLMPVSVVTGTSTNTTTLVQTFPVTARDALGYADISLVYFLVSPSSVILPNTCHGFYHPPSNSLYLYNDSLTAVLGPLIVGTSGILQNSQCTVFGMTSSLVSTSGTDLVLNLGLGLRGTYTTAAERVFFLVADNEGHNSGWAQTGSWTVSNQMPSVVAGTLTNSTAITQILPVTARSPRGYADVSLIYFLVSPSTAISGNTCHGFYYWPSNSLFLYDDSLTVVSGPITASGSGILQNGQCTVYGLTSSLVSASGTDVRLNLGLGLRGAYTTATENVYFLATDNEGHNSGWVQTGSWTASSHAPNVLSGTMTNSTTITQAFPVTVRDLDGYADISMVYFLVGPAAATSPSTCHGFYHWPSNGLYLYNDSLTSASGPLTPGSSGTLQNSQCTVYGSMSSLVSASGTDLVLNLGLGLRGAYTTTAEKVYFLVTDNESHNSGWVQTGNWTAGNLSVVAGTLTNSTTATQAFPVTVRDRIGYADISLIYFLVGSSTAISQNSCHGFYYWPSNGLYLYNDSLTAASGPLIAGGSGTLQNGQCTVFGSMSSLVSASGTDLVLNLGLGLRGAYATGPQKVYFLVTDNEGRNSGWMQTGTWAPQ